MGFAVFGFVIFVCYLLRARNEGKGDLVAIMKD
jgi:hypothetical protein